MTDIDDIVQDVFETVMKFNFRCPKGKFVQDSFACGETPAEAKKNYKAYQKEKKQVQQDRKTTKSAKKSVLDAKKKVKKISDVELKRKMDGLIAKVEEEKKSGKVSKESYRALKTAIKELKKPVPSSKIEQVTPTTKPNVLKVKGIDSDKTSKILGKFLYKEQAKKTFNRSDVQEIISRTKGAKLTKDGLELDLVRYQEQEQAGATALRSGVFYLPEKKSSVESSYSDSSENLYGGSEKIEGRSVFRNPLIVNGKIGGEVAVNAFKQLEGSERYNALKRDIYSKCVVPKKLKLLSDEKLIKNIEDVLSKYGGDPSYAKDIYEVSKKVDSEENDENNFLPVTIQENIFTHSVRNAGYDAVIGIGEDYESNSDEKMFTEVLDVRSNKNPKKTGWDERFDDYYDKFEPKKTEKPKNADDLKKFDINKMKEGDILYNKSSGVFRIGKISGNKVELHSFIEGEEWDINSTKDSILKNYNVDDWSYVDNIKNISDVKENSLGVNDIVQETFDNFIKTKCKKIDNGKYECDSIDIVKVAPMTWKSVRKSDIDEFKLNYRCKKEEQVGEGPGSCGGKKSVPKEKVISVKKPSVPEASDASSIVHGIVNKSSKGDFDKLTKTLSDIDISELSELETKLDDELRNFDIKTEGSKKYERLSAIYQVTRDVYKSRMEELRISKKSEPVVHSDFEDIKGAINTLGSDVKILGKVSKSKTIATLNAISKERARIYNEYPLLQNLEISAYKIDDDSLNSKHAVAKFDGSDNTMSLLSDSASRGKMAWKSKGSNAKLYDYGIKKTYSETAQDFYRHEVGHAALQQLTTKEERSALYSTWGDRVKNEGFGSKSDTWNALERSVSSYAVKSEDEAFAEIFAKISGGEDVDSSIYPELINPIKRILTKGSKLNATVQDIFDQIMKLNYRCKKEEQVGEGPGSCGGKKSVPKEKMVSIKKPNVPKQTTPKAKRSTKSKPVAQKAPQDLDSILKMPGDTDTFYNAMEKHMSKLSANELIEISKKYERAMRAPGYEKIPYEEYSRMSLTYVTAKDMAKDAKLSKPKVQNVEIKSIDDAKKVLGVEDVWHDGNKPKASVIKSLNVIAKEHTRLLQDYPNLQRVNIKFMNFPDEGMERDGINGHYLMNSISMSSKLPTSERETRSLDGGVLMRGVGISGTYRHEFGHAVEDQLFTKEEKDGVSRLWKKLEDDNNKSGGFGSDSMKKQVGRVVSEYAIKNSMELVAEMFCEMAKGKTYPDTFCPEVQAPIKRILFGGK